MNDGNLVPALLSIITPSSQIGTDEEWDLTLRFVDQHGNDDLAEVIFANTPVSTEPWKVGSLFDHLIWNISDEAVERMLQTLETWLCGNDRRRISYALAMEYVFPFREPEQMFKVIEDLKFKWPEFTDRCSELIERRGKLQEPN